VVLTLLLLLGAVVVAQQCSRSESTSTSTTPPPAAPASASGPVLSPQEQREEWLDKFNQPVSDAKKLEYAEAILRSDPSSTEALAVKPQIEALRAKIKQAEADARERGNWQYDSYSDALSKGSVKAATVSSENQLSFDFPYQGLQSVRLMLRNHPQHGRDVILRIEQGQIICSSYSCPISVVFDDGKPLRFEGTEPTDNSTEVVFIPAYSTFLKRLATAKTMRIGFTVHQEGQQVAEFKVKGFDASKLK
jgi:hypothetical protein